MFERDWPPSTLMPVAIVLPPRRGCRAYRRDIGRATGAWRGSAAGVKEKPALT